MVRRLHSPTCHCRMGRLPARAARDDGCARPQGDGGQLSRPDLGAYMIAAHEGIEPTDFPQPAAVDWVTVQIDPESGLLSTEWCETTRDVRFISGTQPTEECPLHSPK